MSRQKAKRTKAYKPKTIVYNPLTEFFGGMSGVHADHLRVVKIKNHASLSAMARGTGTKNDWDQLVGFSNIALVLCEQGIGQEFREILVQSREALLACGMRSVRNNYRFLFTGDELRTLNEALDVHDAQLENIRAIDVERAYNEVERRLRHHIDSVSVMGEIRRIDAEHDKAA